MKCLPKKKINKEPNEDQTYRSFLGLNLLPERISSCRLAQPSGSASQIVSKFTPLFDRFRCSSLCVCDRNDERDWLASSLNLLLERFNVVSVAVRRALDFISEKKPCHALPLTEVQPLSFSLRSESPMQSESALEKERQLEWEHEQTVLQEE